MPTARTYTTAAAFRRALEERLRRSAQADQIDLNRLRRQVSFDRLLARLFREEAVPWALKGGYALELWFRAARSTIDIDLTLQRVQAAETGDANQVVREMLQNAADASLGDWFEYTIGPPVLDLTAGQRSAQGRSARSPSREQDQPPIHPAPPSREQPQTPIALPNREQPQPPNRPVPPNREQAQPPMRQAPPNREQAQPPQRPAPPNREQAKPPESQAPPAREQSRPPERQAPPNREEARPPERQQAPPPQAQPQRPTPPPQKKEDKKKEEKKPEDK